MTMIRLGLNSAAAATLLSVAAMLAVPAHAEGATDLSAVGREEMGRIFFTNQERKILEAVRKGLISEVTDVEINESLAAPFIVPSASVFPFSSEDEGPLRGEDIFVNGFIKSNRTNKTTVWFNGKVVRGLTEEIAYEGIVLDTEKSGSALISGVDHYEQQRVEFKVGQIVSREGAVLETLPVVRSRDEDKAMAEAAAEAAAAPTEEEAEAQQ